MFKGSRIACFVALLVLAPPLASAQMATAAAGKPLLLAQLTPPPLPQPPSVQYFYNDNGKPAGPLTLAEIQAKIAAGAIKPDTLVWKTGLPGWVAAKELTEIATIFAGGPARAPAPIPVASGCTGKVQFSDLFRQVDDSWGVDPDSDVVIVEDGKLKVKSNPDATSLLLYNGQNFDDADYCVTVQSPNNLKDAKDQPLSGLIFWARDGSNLYALVMAPNARVTLGRLVKDKWTPLAKSESFGSFHAGAGARNALQVSTSGASITAYVNGQKFASVTGQAPDGGGTVGFIARSQPSNRDSWKFYALKVTEHSP